MIVRTVITALMLAALAGCGSPPKERYYVLSTHETPDAQASPAAFAVAVGPVFVPELVDRPQMVVRVAANRMDVSDLNRWAEPLKRSLARAIAASIAQSMPSARVYVATSDTVPKADYRVRIEVERFDSELGKSASVDAAWSIGGGGTSEVRLGRSRVREAAAGPGYDELVAAHSAAAAAIGRDIAAALQAIKK